MAIGRLSSKKWLRYSSSIIRAKACTATIHQERKRVLNTRHDLIVFEMLQDSFVVNMSMCIKFSRNVLICMPRGSKKYRVLRCHIRESSGYTQYVMCDSPCEGFVAKITCENSPECPADRTCACTESCKSAINQRARSACDVKRKHTRNQVNQRRGCDFPPHRSLV